MRHTPGKFGRTWEVSNSWLIYVNNKSVCEHRSDSSKALGFGARWREAGSREESRLAGPTQKPPGGRSVDVLLGSDRPLWNLPFCSDTHPAQGAHTLVGRHCDRVPPPPFPWRQGNWRPHSPRLPAMQDGWSGSHDHGGAPGLPLLHPHTMLISSDI